MFKKEEENMIFGLDIGTRTIIGVVGYKQAKEFVIVATEVVEHESRAMIDGQIHDILAVARGAKKVKELLENQLGFPLKEVAIAAAGRVLKTVRVSVEKHFEEVQAIDGFTIKALELQGIKEAQVQIKNDHLEEENGYFFVGHSVVHYYLNDYLIANLEEQKGKKIRADILATFLPKLVVESLYTVMDKIGLKVIYTTLEPIAAINTVIPSNLRMLNIALIDIGAGTSDIAITKEGSVMAYGMIPLAGDEITEKIVHTYLVDFKTAENIKQQLGNKNTVEFLDIIGMSHKILTQDVLAVIDEVIDELGTKIASKIIELNGNKSPNAVFCVGGGSQTPHITEVLADKLMVALERVAIRSREHAVGVIDHTKKIKGPESITPLGICLTTMLKEEDDFVEIKINNKQVKLLHTRQLTVADGAIAIGLDHTQILSVRGKTLMFKLNGERRRIKGGVGTQPRIICNKKEVNLDANISQGDELVIYPAQNGEDAQVFLEDLVEEIGLANQKVEIIVNDQVVDMAYKVQHGDDIIIKAKADTILETLIDEIKQTESKPEEKLLYVTVNGEPIGMPFKETMLFVTIFDFIDFDLSVPKGNIVLKLNGNRASYTDLLKDGDRIDIYWDEKLI